MLNTLRHFTAPVLSRLILRCNRLRTCPQCLRSEDATPAAQLQRVEIHLPSGSVHALLLARLPADLLHRDLRSTESRSAHLIPHNQLDSHGGLSVHTKDLRDSLHRRGPPGHWPWNDADGVCGDHDRGAPQRTMAATPQYGCASHDEGWNL